jgi:hypothetical protein
LTATPGKGMGSLPSGNPGKEMAAERKEDVCAERDGDRDSERASTLLFMAATHPKAEYRLRARRRLVLFGHTDEDIDEMVRDFNSHEARPG